MDWATMVQPGTSQIHAAATPTMHMAPPMVVSRPRLNRGFRTATTEIFNSCKTRSPELLKKFIFINTKTTVHRGV